MKQCYLKSELINQDERYFSATAQNPIPKDAYGTVATSEWKMIEKNGLHLIGNEFCHLSGRMLFCTFLESFPSPHLRTSSSGMRVTKHNKTLSSGAAHKITTLAISKQNRMTLSTSTTANKSSPMTISPLHMSSDVRKQVTSTFLQPKQAIQTITNRKTLKRSRKTAMICRPTVVESEILFSPLIQENYDDDDSIAFPAIQWPDLDDSSSSSLSDVESDSECESFVGQPASKRRCRGLVRSMKASDLATMA